MKIASQLIKSTLTLILFIVSAQTTFSQIIISEYLEGASNDKCIELFNVSGTPVNLTGYSIQIYFNGNSSVGNTINLSGTIPSCGTYVVCNSSANSTLTGLSDMTSGSMTFNGDDAVALFNGGTMLDLIGNIGEDPGSEWSGVGGGTANEGIIRNPGYCSGVTSDPGGTGFPTFTAANWSAVGQAGGDLGSHTNTCAGCSTPSVTITAGAVTGSPFTIDCTTGAAGTIAFTSTGTFNSGNVFTAQLSDNTGSFASPVDIGTLSGVLAEGTDPSSSIPISIPAGTPSGTYEIQITSSDPSGTSSNSTTISITLTSSCEPPYITSVIINSCNPTCTEGYNELIFGNTGDYSVNLNSTDFQISYGSTAPPGTNPTLTDNLTTNPTTTAALNTAAGCPGTYIDATGMTIPPGASYMLAHDGLCTDALDWAGLCGAGPIYVVYTTDSDWNTNGNFSNSTAAGTRYFNSTITTTTTETFSIDYEYDRTQNSGTDGDYVTYNSAGGAPQAYGDDDCVLNPVVLPIELIDFTGTDVNGNVHLSWTTATEINSDYFILTHSTDGIYFSEFENVDAAGNSIQPIDYEEIHREAQNGVNYYRLIGVDYDGSMKNHGTIAVLVEMSSAFFDPINNQIVFTDKCSANIYALDGKLVAQSNNASVIPFNKKGVFLVIDTVTGKQQKLIIQ